MTNGRSPISRSSAKTMPFAARRWLCPIRFGDGAAGRTSSRGFLASPRRSQRLGTGPQRHALDDVLEECPTWGSSTEVAALILMSASPPTSDIRLTVRHFRFGPKSDIGRIYSTTSSATARIFAGKSRPSAFAVLRLITSTSLVACTTGRSAGLSPFRMRPA